MEKDGASAEGMFIPPDGDDKASKLSHGVASAFEKEDMQQILRLIAQKQLQLVKATNGSGGGGKARILASVRIPNFEGAQNTSAKLYREWRKDLSLIQKLNSLTDTEVAMLLLSQLKGRAKDLIELLEVEDFEKTDVLALIWKVYDEAFERIAHERLNDVHENLEKAYRKPGTPMQD